ncbi:MAG: lytic murein transglycosylase, partial [Mangrovicoccus sp.]|nr:lytic murein transglycosylase [Mangrovicoccus sp.]
MTLTRRGALGLLAMTALASCAGGASAPKQTTKTVWLVVPDAGFDAWLAGFRGRALAQGVSPATFDAAFRKTGFIPAVIEKDRNQTEFTRTTEDYLAIAASEERVSLGRQDLARYGNTLDQIEARYGVEKETVAAVWGME